jgi:hypothetical protein
VGARARYLVVLVALSAWAPAAASASPTAKLKVQFLPNRLGHGTSVEFGVRISTTNGEVPSPLSELDMHYPSTLGFAVSGLGLATCSRAKLEALGATSCPANSHMGRGSVIVAIPFGPEVVEEEARVTVVRAPQEGRVALLFYAEGEEPVAADIAFTGLLSEGATSGSESILVNVPLVEGLPEGPDVSVVELHATFGPLGLTYLERVRGKFVAYKPRGILLPNHCPHGGFPFAADFAFLDGSRATATTRVPCPRSRSS